MVRILLVTDDSGTHRVVFGFLPCHYASMDICNHRICICNYLMGIRNHHMGIYNHHVGIDREFRLKQCC